jgi:hypothetical protein
MKPVVRTLLVLLAGLPHLILAQESIEERKIEPEEPEVSIEWEDEQHSTLGANRIFSSPALASGLSGSIDQLNRSFDSLMEAVFYSLLDNDLAYDVTDASEFTTSLKRDVHNAADGSYIIVDRFAVGPKYLSPLTTIQKIPLNIGGEGAINVINIYRRTDGMRLADNEEQPFYRVALNNWFGLLPLLTKILPPSFNPNQLFDPVTQLQTPFVFPFTPEDVQAMPLGSIRSYSISGGIQVSFDPAGNKLEEVQEALKGMNDVQLTLPYTIYKKGEHRISVLRRSKDRVWVALTDSHRLGHGLHGIVGAIGRIFTKVSPHWSGVPTLLFPIDVSGDIYDLLKYDQLYEFDLSDKSTWKAYKRATQGDFSLAQALSKESATTKPVIFHFKKKEEGIESEIRNARNLFIHRDTRSVLREDLEIETIDDKGRIDTLEARMQIEDQNWNALVGDEQVNFNGKVTLKVIKKGEDHYEFGEHPEPYTMILSLNINDRFADVLNFKRYLALLRFFTKLPLKDVPEIPLRVSEDIAEKRREATLIDPTRDIHNLHVTPTYLGRTTIHAGVYFPYSQLQKIFKSSEAKMWRAFAKVYGLNPKDWDTKKKRSTFSTKARWLTAGLAYPLRLFNFRIPGADAITEMSDRISALKRLKESREPLKLLDDFYDLLETDHPAHLTAALLELADLSEVPRSISFSTERKGDDRGENKRIFASLNGKVYQSRAKFPVTDRHDAIREKEALFDPKNVREVRDQPYISHILVSTKPVTTLGEDKLVQQNHIQVQINVKNIPVHTEAKVLARIEEAGKLNIARLLLAEGVVPIAPESFSPSEEGTKNNVATYTFFLTGPESPFSTFLLDRAVAGGSSFDVTLSVAVDDVWTKEKKISFRFQDGKLLNP